MAENYWSPDYAPEYADKLHDFHGFLYSAHNGQMDVERFISDEYGTELGRRLQLRFRIEDEPMGEAALSYYRSIGLRKEMFETEDYYTRWALFTPLELGTPEAEGKSYPLVFWHHGGANHIESFEVVSGICDVAGREKFIVCMPQNTNWDNVDRLIDVIAGKYPVDLSRVYVTGFSQGGAMTQCAQMHLPGRVAAVGIAGNEIFKPTDSRNIPYTEAELQRVKEDVVPMLVMVGGTEPSGYAPLNNWYPRMTPQASVWPGSPDTAKIERDIAADVTRMEVTLEDGTVVRRMPPNYSPSDTDDRHTWRLIALNRRLDLLGCRGVDLDTCVAFLDHPEDELHHATGVCSDDEGIETYFGKKHYRVSFRNDAGTELLRYMVMDRHPHWPALMFGELSWQFMRRFRRNLATGKLIVEE